jgi:hypothetical protein
MTLSHFYKANLSPRQQQRAIDESEALFTDVSPAELAGHLGAIDSEMQVDGLDLVMSVRMSELRRERGFFIHD